MKVLLVGPGLIGVKHAKLIHENENMTLSAIVSPNKEKHADLMEEYQIPFYDSLIDALDTQEFDAVVISSPNELHYEHAKLCMLKGLPVLVEKPLTSCLIEAKKLVELSKETAIPLLVADHRLYNPLLYTAKRFIQSPKFGNVVSYMGSAQFYKPASYFKVGPWRAKIGGGPILINLIHEIGVMRVLCGEIDKVFAFSSNKIRGFEVEDTVSISLEFKNGALGTFMLSDTAVSNKSWEMTTGENHAYPHYPKEWTYHIAGTKASLDFPKMKFRMYDDAFEASWWRPFYDDELKVEHENPLEIQLQHFYDVVTKGIEITSSAENGYRNMLVVEAVKRSIIEKRPVLIEEIEF